MNELNWFSVIWLTFLTVVQHESGVILWYRSMQGISDTHLGAAGYAFVIISVIDWVWLYFLWLITDKSLIGISNLRWVRQWTERHREKRWFQRIVRAFSSETSAEVEEKDSKFRRMLKQSGYLGIGLCAVLPGPGLKEVGIIMGLTPRYRRAGFQILYFGGLIKTILTMLIYGGLMAVFVRLLD